jgi:hypothetical protein
VQDHNGLGGTKKQMKESNKIGFLPPTKNLPLFKKWKTTRLPRHTAGQTGFNSLLGVHLEKCSET